ncbi:MAG: PQQ-binding-like beta-propeller repeat protein [Phycisphaerales bacterium]|nr:MAG: PQQ-binding-like beta-propeller repeat protein [Phycisphaerales bacterium]
MRQRKVPGSRGKEFLASVLTALALLPISIAQAQEWTRFRGPNGQGISEAKTIPGKWAESDYNWKVELPGGGHSSPVLWGDRLFVTCGDQKAGHAMLLALSVSDGAVLWQKEYTLTAYRMSKLNSYATTTPALDSERVYVLWTTPEETILAALDHEGTEIWKRTFEGVRCQHGAGSSPIVQGEMVVFTHEHENTTSKDAKSAWIAVDRRTGETRWAVERQTGPKTSYSTPCVYSREDEAPQLIFTSHSHGMTGVDPRMGKVIWAMESVLPARVVSSPVIAGELLIAACGDGGRGKRLTAIRPGASDGTVHAVEAYNIDAGLRPYVPTPISRDGLLFTFLDQGHVSCLRTGTGERLWQEKPAGRFFGSPVWVDAKLYCITMDGDVVVIRAADTYELLAVNPLGETSHATPAVAGGRMYLRTYSHLFSIGGKK